MALSPSGAELKVLSRTSLLDNARRGGEHLFEAIWFMVEEWLELLLAGPNLVALPPLFFVVVGGGADKSGAGSAAAGQS